MENVEQFLKQLGQQSPTKSGKTFEKKRTIEKLYVNIPQNFGRYMIFPMDSVITDNPFAVLKGTREINVPRKNISSDGQETVYNAWIKILPAEAYQMKDMTGRVVSSLTAADSQLLSQAQLLFDELYNELDPMNNRDNKSIYSLIRKRNYTVFNAYCLSYWNVNQSRTPSRQNFSALFVVTAKSFIDVVQNSIAEKTTMDGGDTSWIPQVYNRKLSGRDGFLMFSINADKSGRPGFSVTASHEYGRAKSLEGYNIPEDMSDLMQDPVSNFLGWQAGKTEDEPPYQRLFNPDLIKSTIEYMSEQLAAIRTAKQTGITIDEAIKKTTEDALSKQTPIGPNGRASNDPVLNQMASQAAAENGGPQVVNAQKVVENNNSPFDNPASAHIDPLSGAPVNPNPTPNFGGGFGGGNNSNPFGGNSQPSWGGFGNNAAANQQDDGSDLPF